MQIVNAEKKLVGKLVEECSENIDEKELNSNELISVTSNDFENVCGSCAIYIVLLDIFFIISISISCAFFIFIVTYKKSNTAATNINPSTETLIC